MFENIPAEYRSGPDAAPLSMLVEQLDVLRMYAEGRKGVVVHPSLVVDNTKNMSTMKTARRASMLRWLRGLPSFSLRA